MSKNNWCDVCYRKDEYMHAVLRCQKCEENYCRQCSKTHRNFKSLQNHNVFPLHEEKPSLLTRFASLFSLNRTEESDEESDCEAPPKHKSRRPASHGDKGQRQNERGIENGEAKITSKPAIFCKFEQSFNTMCVVDSKKSKISGIACLPDGRVVMVDSSNRNLKVFSKHFVFLMSIGLQKGCRSVTSVYGNEVAVTEAQKVQFYLVGDSEIEKVTKFFPIDGLGYVISYERDHYAVCFQRQTSEKAIQIVDKYVENISVIVNSECFGQQIEITANILLNPNEDTLFVADGSTARVLCFTYSGEPLWQTHMEHCPSGFVIVGKSLITSIYSSSEIQAINYENGCISEVQVNPKGKVQRPYLLTYQHSKKCILVTHNIISGNEVDVVGIEKDGDEEKSRFSFPCNIL